MRQPIRNWRNWRNPALAALLAASVLAPAARASEEGRIMANVVDDAGKPVAGAKAVLRQEPATSFRLEKASGNDGRFTMLVLDATKDYVLHVEKAGLDPFDGPLKVPVGDTLRVTVTLSHSAAPAPTPPPELVAKNDAIVAFNTAVEALRKGDMTAAVPSLQKAIALDPKLAEAQSALAEVLLELKRNDEALVAADAYLALRPGEERALRDRYDAVKALGDAARTKEALAALMAAPPKEAETAVRLFNEGAEHTRGGDYDAAAPYFEAVTRIVPDDVRFAKAHYVLALAYAKDESRAADARAHLEKFLALVPADPDAAAAKEMLGYLTKKN
jgi:tetratricopeptide (TPR) repeat protein